jgi:hypothetical protein
VKEQSRRRSEKGIKNYPMERSRKSSNKTDFLNSGNPSPSIEFK